MQETFEKIKLKVEETFKIKVLSVKKTTQFGEPYISITLDTNSVNSDLMGEISETLSLEFPELSNTHGFLVESKGLYVMAKNQAEFTEYLGKSLCFTSPQFKGCATLTELDEEHAYFETKVRAVKKTLKIKFQNLSNITLE